MKWGIKKRKDSDVSLRGIRNDFDRIFDDFFSLRPSQLIETEWYPNVDVWDDEKAIHVKAEVPGIEEKDLDVQIKKNMLSIKGEKREENEEKIDSGMLKECSYGAFTRTIALPEGIDVEKVKADFKNGVLSIHIPKNEGAKPKKISIKAS